MACCHNVSIVLFVGSIFIIDPHLIHRYWFHCLFSHVMDLVKVIYYYLRQDPYNTDCLRPGWRACERNVGQGSPHNTSSVFAQFFSPQHQAPLFGLAEALMSSIFLRDPIVYFLYKKQPLFSGVLVPFQDEELGLPWVCTSVIYKL